jgi:hypothetical protein
MSLQDNDYVVDTGVFFRRYTREMFGIVGFTKSAARQGIVQWLMETKHDNQSLIHLSITSILR